MGKFSIWHKVTGVFITISRLDDSSLYFLTVVNVTWNFLKWSVFQVFSKVGFFFAWLNYVSVIFNKINQAFLYFFLQYLSNRGYLLRAFFSNCFLVSFTSRASSSLNNRNIWRQVLLFGLQRFIQSTTYCMPSIMLTMCIIEGVQYIIQWFKLSFYMIKNLVYIIAIKQLQLILDPKSKF